MTSNMIKFDLPKNQSSIIKVVGVGGGGSNAVNYMYRMGIEGVDFLVCNTDAQALEVSPVPNKIQLGVSLTDGRGAGSIPAVGKNAAIEDIDNIKSILEKNTKMVFITAGMGGGTGTGAAPVIAAVARELGILTVGIVTVPFAFEGRKRRQQAEEGLKELREQVDTLLVICNDKIRELHGNLAFTEAFAKADNVLTTAAKGIAEVITLTGHVNVDFADVRTVMTNSGVAIMGSGMSEGESRATKAVQLALSSPLLNDNNIRGARNILLNITFGNEELLMDEIMEITEYVQDEAGSTADIIWGLGHDKNLGNKINVTLIATGFESENSLVFDIFDRKEEKKVHPLEPKASFQENRRTTNVEVDDMKLVQKAQVPDTSVTTIMPPKNTTGNSSLTMEFEIGQKVEVENKLETFDNDFNPDDIQIKNSSARTVQAQPSYYADVQQDELVNKRQDRLNRLRELSLKVKSPEGVEDLENVPAFVRRNVVISQPIPSSESQVSRYTLNETEDRKVHIKPNNSFLHDTVD